jgi:hypothetical protein
LREAIICGGEAGFSLRVDQWNVDIHCYKLRIWYGHITVSHEQIYANNVLFIEHIKNIKSYMYLSFAKLKINVARLAI